MSGHKPKWIMKGREIVEVPNKYRDLLRKVLLDIVIGVLWLYSIWAKTFDWVFGIKEESVETMLKRVRRKLYGI